MYVRAYEISGFHSGLKPEHSSALISPVELSELIESENLRSDTGRIIQSTPIPKWLAHVGVKGINDTTVTEGLFKL